METIVFYHNGEDVGRCKYIEGSNIPLRHAMAKDAGVKQYDRFEILKHDGTTRIDSDSVEKEILADEFNVSL